MAIEERILAELDGKYWQYGVIPTSGITFTIEAVKACESNRCGKYGSCWTCPPAIGTYEESIAKIRKYDKAFVFTTKHELEDSYDFPGMMDAKEKHDKLSISLQQKLGKDFKVFGAGGCSICEKCTYPEPCVSPDIAIQSLEGSGIFVSELAKALGINYINGENTVTYFSMIIYKE